jgi:hypothetical protein
MGGFEVESLAARRETACVKLACKLMAGKGRGSLADFAPSVVRVQARSRHQADGLLTGLFMALSDWVVY